MKKLLRFDALVDGDLKLFNHSHSEPGKIKSTIRDKSHGSNLHFWRFCAHVRREYNFICRTSDTNPPHTMFKTTCNFFLIFNIVIRRTGKTNAKLFFEFYVMHENANYIYAWNCFRKRLLVFTLRAFSHYTLAWRPTVLNRTNGISGPPLPSFQWRLLKERVFAFSRLHHFFGGNGG